MKIYCYGFFIIGCLMAKPAQAFEVAAAKPQEVVCHEDEEMFDEFDEFDALVEDALKVDVLKPEIVFDKKSAFEMAVIKASMPLLRVYSFTVLKYRAFKIWFATLWSRIFGRNA